VNRTSSEASAPSRSSRSGAGGGSEASRGSFRPPPRDNNAARGGGGAAAGRLHRTRSCPSEISNASSSRSAGGGSNAGRTMRRTDALRAAMNGSQASNGSVESKKNEVKSLNTLEREAMVKHISDQLGCRHKSLQKAYRSLDQDFSGSIDKAEHRDWLGKMGYPAHVADGFWKTLEKDGKMTFKEFQENFAEAIQPTYELEDGYKGLTSSSHAVHCPHIFNLTRRERWKA